MHTIHVQQLTKHFKQGTSDITVLSHLSITFSQQHTYAITGMSGSGKSTFMHIIGALDTPSQGTVLFDTTNIGTMSETQKNSFLNTKIGFVFQRPYLIAELSVAENIMLPGIVAQKNTKECIARAQELLSYINLISKMHEKVGSLSGGQQQRVALARALFNKPAFLIADEPTGNLDETTGKSIIELLRSCKQQWGMGIIVSTHDDYVARAMEQVFELKEGNLVRSYGT
ncbi:MAG TPA: ABC transporter ATP-binding protein [Candidatus Bathyarchaeia archaeon]|nr:ABC transporter ATP-binding protein [Candidatus Bathyarchaeia archaeon]